MSYGVDHRLGSDPKLLWLWCKPAAAAPIQPLAWKLPYAMGVALKIHKQTNKQTPQKTKNQQNGKERQRGTAKEGEEEN